MLAVVWHYHVRPGAEAAFETLYGAHGGWVALFRDYPGYIGTELLRDESPGRYLSIDRWQSEAHYAAFLEAAKPRYAALDAEGDALTMSERRIGRYMSC